MATPLVLVSHVLCPYVQRAAIVMHEKGIAFERRDIDLSNKPDWFVALSPTGKTPLLLVGDTPIFESSVICEYLDDIALPRLHPADPLERARHRAWMAFASTVLDAIGALYNAPGEDALAAKACVLRAQFERIEEALASRPHFDEPFFDRHSSDGPFFDGPPLNGVFSMVDAAFAPALRYFEVIDGGAWRLFDGLPRLAAWRAALAQRPSVKAAVGPAYHKRLRAFLAARDSVLGARMRDVAGIAA